MKKFTILERLANIFRSDVVWIDKGQGRWVKRRRYHPALKAAVAAMLLLLAALWGAEFYRRWGETRQRAPAEPESVAKTETLPTPPVAEEPEDPAVGYDPPIPAGLSVKDDEYWIRINKALFELRLYRGSEVDRIYTVAVGKNPGDKQRVGDNRTPNGIFTVQSIENSRAWTHDFRDGKGSIAGAYGPWFIRLRTGWKGIGIHGTHDPASRGSMVSEGCIRMLNGELEDLKEFVFRNMKVVIEEEWE